jgi:uncharacterized protein (DUF2164 family)
MNEIKRKWERLTDDKKKACLDEIIIFFENERDEKIGVIAAEQVLNIFLQTAGTELYNKGVEDAKKTLEHRLDDLHMDLDLLLD